MLIRWEKPSLFSDVMRTFAKIPRNEEVGCFCWVGQSRYDWGPDLIIMWWQLSFSAVCYTVARPLTVTITLWWHWYRVMRVAREIAWNVLKVEILIGRMIHCSLCSYTFVFSSVKKWYMKDITGYRNKRQWTQHCTNCQCSDPNVNMKQVLIFMLR